MVENSPQSPSPEQPESTPSEQAPTAQTPASEPGASESTPTAQTPEPQPAAPEPVAAAKTVAPEATPPPVSLGSSSPQTSLQPTQERVQQVAKQVWQQVQPLLFALSIGGLRITIRGLDALAQKLEASRPTPPASAAQPTIPPQWQTFLSKLWTQLRALLEKLQAWWTPTLANQIRPRLPASLNQLPDNLLTGAIVAALILVFWIITSILSPGKPSAEVAKSPTAPRQTGVVATAPAPVKSPVVVKPVEIKPPSIPKPITIKPSTPPAIPVKTPSSIPLKTPTTSAPTPAATVVLTPEPTLIATIQDQLADTVEPYADGLIRAVQPNVQGSRLIVKVNKLWYDLSPSKQDKVADQLMQQAQSLDFSKLELIDPQQTLIARSPVVGSQMVVVRRHPLSSATPEPTTPKLG